MSSGDTCHWTLCWFSGWSSRCSCSCALCSSKQSRAGGESPVQPSTQSHRWQIRKSHQALDWMALLQSVRKWSELIPSARQPMHVYALDPTLSLPCPARNCTPLIGHTSRVNLLGHWSTLARTSLRNLCLLCPWWSSKDLGVNLDP